MSSNQENMHTFWHILALSLGTISYIVCSISGIILLTDAVSVTLTHDLYIDTWRFIIAFGVSSVLLLGRFYGFSNYFQVSIYIAAIIYLMISIADFVAIHLFTHPDSVATNKLEAVLGLELNNISSSNKSHLWMSLLFYGISAFNLLTLGGLFEKKEGRKLGERTKGDGGRKLKTDARVVPKDKVSGVETNVGAAQTGLRITRYPDISIPSEISIDHTILLRIAVTQQPRTPELEKYAMEMSVSSKCDSIELDVLVTADGFEILDHNFKKLVVPINNDSDPIVFPLRAKAVGNQNIKVEFFQDSRYVGGLTVSTTIIIKKETGQTAQLSGQGIVNLDDDAMPPDLTLLISQNNPEEHQYTYSFTLLSQQAGLYFHTVSEKLILSETPSRWISSQFRELESLYQQQRYQDIPATLETIGAHLYEILFPKELKRIWQQHIRDKIKSIQIVSDEPWIPWELIRPSYETEDGEYIEDNFLCEDYLIGRWLNGPDFIPPPLASLKLSRGTYVIPNDSNLKFAQQEKDILQSLGFMVYSTPPLLNAIRSLFQNGGYELIHFACHASFVPEEHEQSVIYLQDDDKLKSRDISGKYRTFGRYRPLVFVNACQAARADFTLVGIGSWAQKFLSAKTSAFLGPAWSVGDEAAYRFSEAFYQELKYGEPLGQAVRIARAKIKKLPDTSWLSYVLYGDPLARVSGFRD